MAVGRLKAQGLEVERIRAVPGGGVSSRPERTVELRAARTPLGSRAVREIVLPVVSGVALRDAAMLFRQMATLVGAGLPLYQALVSCEAQTRNPRLKGILRDCQTTVMSGGRLTEALEAHSYAFSDLQLAMLRAAEHGGSLDTALARLAQYLEQELALRRTISRLTLYPKLVLLSALFILGRSFFSDGMPAVSKAIVGTMGRLSYTGLDYLADTVLVLLYGAALVIAAVAVTRTVSHRSPSFRIALERIKLAIPGVGSVSRGFALTRFGRAFGAMYAAGLPMGESVRVAGDASGSYVLREGAERVVESVERGESASAAFARAGVLPPLVLDMLRTGEQTGNLDAMMEKVAEHLEGESEARAYQYSHLFATAIYLIVAGLVGFAVVRFWSGYSTGLGG
jgi:type II secretory pathway component PulF